MNDLFPQGRFAVGRLTLGEDVMLSGNAFSALKDITAISKEREWVSGPFAWFSGLFPYVQVSKLNVTA